MTSLKFSVKCWLCVNIQLYVGRSSEIYIKGRSIASSILCQFSAIKPIEFRLHDSMFNAESFYLIYLINISKVHQGYTEVYILKNAFKDKFNFHLENLTTREMLTLFRSRFMMSCTLMLRNDTIIFQWGIIFNLHRKSSFQIYTELNQITILNNGVKDNRAPYLKAQKCWLTTFSTQVFVQQFDILVDWCRSERRGGCPKMGSQRIAGPIF